MLVTLMKAKLHRATVTQADLDYEGSIAIDGDLLDAAGIFPHEQVDVLNITNGARFTTYAIEAPRGSKVIGVNGAAARLVQKNDKVIVVTYGQMPAGRSPPVVADRGAAGRRQRDQARGLITRCNNRPRLSRRRALVRAQSRAGPPVACLQRPTG